MVLFCGALVAGCGAAPTDGDFHGAEPVGTVSEAQTVAQAVSGGCSTNAVAGLNQQIIDEMNCLIPGGALKAVPSRPNFVKGGATLAWMQPPAADALVAALDAKPGTTLTANSMLRTVAAQYLLYRWYQNGTCGISLAATPGTSNHESGLAIDVGEYNTWMSTLQAHGFKWLGSSDVVHFDYAGAGTVDLKGKDVLAFQKLWNLNNPGDLITEDGIYGPQTGARLEKSPTGGFSTPPSCGSGGSGGTGGTGGTGSGGTAGSGTGGTGGVGGVGGTGGVGGVGGTGGTGGTGGVSGTGGTGGFAGAAPGTGGTSGGVCVPGEPVACACAGGGQGYQLCNADGTGLDPCSCFGTGGSGNSSGNQATHTSANSGCACDVPARAPSPSPWLLALLAGALAGVRRRRRR